VGACDLAELCDAANSTCPPNAFVPNGQPCSIDGASICDGLGVCIPNGCGDHRTAGGEQCDDGNHVDGDGCDRNCTTTACGNGIVTEGEQCDPPASQGGAPRCKNDCLLSVCGNGIVEAGEACDGGVCCTSGCTFRGPTEPCGTETRVCHQQPTCNGREATCPSDPKLSDQGSPCLDTTNACVIGACQQATATCELHGRVCDANAKASKNGTRKVKMKVRCAANAESDCEATVFGVPLLPGATAVTAAGTEPEGEQISADLAPAQTRKKAGRGGLRFRTTLHLTLNERGRALLEAGDVRATVHVTIRRGGLTHRSKQLLNLLRFRR
jgi:cysteine-rich repeat protein